jgi:uncharacterized protein (TIGR03083 family)
MDHLTRDEALPVLAAAYADLTAVLTGLDRAGLAGPTRCAGWTVLELAHHVLADAQRALVAFASPAGGPPDVDYATYWRPFRPANDIAAATAVYERKATAAYARPEIVLHYWAETSAAAVRAAQACPHEHVTTQRHVLTVPDFAGTLAVEAAVHHLDLLDLPGPAPARRPARHPGPHRLGRRRVRPQGHRPPPPHPRRPHHPRPPRRRLPPPRLTLSGPPIRGQRVK